MPTGLSPRLMSSIKSGWSVVDVPLRSASCKRSSGVVGLASAAALPSSEDVLAPVLTAKMAFGSYLVPASFAAAAAAFMRLAISMSSSLASGSVLKITSVIAMRSSSGIVLYLIMALGFMIAMPMPFGMA